MPSIDNFRQELRDQLERATKRRAQNLVINSGELHRAVGDYPGPNQRLHSCCDVMKAEMITGDAIIGDSNYPKCSISNSVRIRTFRVEC
jgi:hypothetical protein